MIPCFNSLTLDHLPSELILSTFKVEEVEFQRLGSGLVIGVVVRLHDIRDVAVLCSATLPQGMDGLRLLQR